MTADTFCLVIFTIAGDIVFALAIYTIWDVKRGIVIAAGVWGTIGITATRHFGDANFGPRPVTIGGGSAQSIYTFIVVGTGKCLITLPCYTIGSIGMGSAI